MILPKQIWVFYGNNVSHPVSQTYDLNVVSAIL